MLPNPGDRIPGTFDQDVYVEICKRYVDAGTPVRTADRSFRNEADALEGVRALVEQATTAVTGGGAH